LGIIVVSTLIPKHLSYALNCNSLFVSELNLRVRQLIFAKTLRKPKNKSFFHQNFVAYTIAYFINLKQCLKFLCQTLTQTHALFLKSLTNLFVFFISRDLQGVAAWVKLFPAKKRKEYLQT
jgi:hypothetical protein